MKGQLNELFKAPYLSELQRLEQSQTIQYYSVGISSVVNKYRLQSHLHAISELDQMQDYLCKLEAEINALKSMVSEQVYVSKIVESYNELINKYYSEQAKIQSLQYSDSDITQLFEKICGKSRPDENWLYMAQACLAHATDIKESSGLRDLIIRSTYQYMVNSRYSASGPSKEPGTVGEYLAFVNYYVLNKIFSRIQVESLSPILAYTLALLHPLKYRYLVNYFIAQYQLQVSDDGTLADLALDFYNVFKQGREQLNSVLGWSQETSGLFGQLLGQFNVYFRSALDKFVIQNGKRAVFELKKLVEYFYGVQAALEMLLELKPSVVDTSADTQKLFDYLTDSDDTPNLMRPYLKYTLIALKPAFNNETKDINIFEQQVQQELAQKLFSGPAEYLMSAEFADELFKCNGLRTCKSTFQTYFRNFIASIQFEQNILYDKDKLCSAFEICKKIGDQIEPETRTYLVYCEKRYMQSFVDVKVKLNKIVDRNEMETEWKWVQTFGIDAPDIWKHIEAYCGAKAASQGEQMNVFEFYIDVNH